MPTMNVRTTVDDDGFSLTEVMVAALVLAIGSAAVAGLLIGALGVTRDNAQRVQAAALAGEEVEGVRSMPADDVPVGPAPPRTADVQGTRFTVSRTVELVTSTGSSDVCTTTSAPTATKRVSVVVEWPDMGSTEPVRSETLLSIPVTSESLDELLGAAAVQVRDDEGVGVDDATVTLSGVALGTSVTEDTGPTGCASFTGLAADTYEASAAVPGYVARSGATISKTGSFTVLPGRVARPRADLAPTATLEVQLTASQGGVVPSALPVTLDAPFFVPSTRQAFLPCSPASTTTACVTQQGTVLTAEVFPGVYRVAGCRTGTTATASAELEPGSSTTVPLALATARLQRAGGGDEDDEGKGSPAVWIRPGTGSACAGAAPFSVTTKGKKVDVALPDGAWDFAPTSGFAAGSTTSATLTASVRTPVTVGARDD